MPPTYATEADFEAYVEGWTTTDSDALERLLMRAERDVDYAAGAHAIPDANLATTGLKFIPDSLPAWQRDALSRATCAQAEYRNLMGEEFMAKAQYEVITGPDISRRGTLPYIGPKTLRELASGNLTRSGAGAGSGSVRIGALSDYFTPPGQSLIGP